MQTFATLISEVSSHAPHGLVIGFGSGSATQELLPEELQITQNWAPHRRSQFAEGRAGARRALSQLGCEPAPILFDDDGAPVWPAGVVGSISHKRDHCVVAVGRASLFTGIGIDLERDLPDAAENDLLQRVCATADERADAKSLLGVTRSPATLFLSAKEAFYKFQFPTTRAELDWDDLIVRFGPRQFTVVPAGPLDVTRTGGEVRGMYWVNAGWMLTVIAESRVLTGP